MPAAERSKREVDERLGGIPPRYSLFEVEAHERGGPPRHRASQDRYSVPARDQPGEVAGGRSPVLQRREHRLRALAGRYELDPLPGLEDDSIRKRVQALPI